MKVAYVTSSTPGEIDRLLCVIAEDLLRDKKKLAGIVKVQDYESSYSNGCDMKVRVLPDGPQIKITQNLGAGSDACRLNPAAIAEAVSRVEASSMRGVDLFILNKFGPEEAAGHGFCGVIANALEQGVPVLVGVGGASIENFESFAGGLAQRLTDKEETVRLWVRDALLAQREQSSGS